MGAYRKVWKADEDGLEVGFGALEEDIPFRVMGFDCDFHFFLDGFGF